MWSSSNPYRLDHSNGGVASQSLVAFSDPGSEGDSGFGLGWPIVAVVELGLQRGPERFGHGVDVPINVRSSCCRLQGCGGAFSAVRTGGSRYKISRATKRLRQRIIFSFRQSFFGSSGDVVDGGLVPAHADDDGSVERGVGLPDAAAVESVGA